MGKRDSKSLDAAGDTDVAAFSNGIRLSIGQWLGVGIAAALLVILLPSLWNWAERLPFEPDQRMPHDLSNDYWLYERYARLAADHYDTLLLGDSVVWGEYVTAQETLSHYFNEQMDQVRCGNLGLDGAHPLALAGLVEHYAASISGKNVLLQCNPLWMSSRRADLQDDKVTEFNHPRLVPQFMTRIPSYKEDMSTRIGIVVEQHLSWSRWTTHLQQAYYERTDVPSWTLEHPYGNPLQPLWRDLPALDNGRRHSPEPWYKSGISKQDYPLVDLQASLQWHAFQRVVQILQERGNGVFVLVGPFNEHLLNPASLRRYQEVKATIAAWLETHHIAYRAPPPLPSELYGDASHPLAQGYALLARQLLEAAFFQSARAPR
jgi:hypothetical protein